MTNHSLSMMRILMLSLFGFMLFQQCATAQLHRELYNSYDQYKERSIKDRRFKHGDIVPLIQQLRPPFRVEKAGESIEGRGIYTVRIGRGPTTVLLWSQMHGDEPTATMALFDLFNFLGRSDRFDSFRQKLLNELTICFIPMLNPDGAEKFQRRNALDIDLNRDALRLQNPEARILKKVRDEMQAAWGFNLHDQSRYTAAGIQPHTASVSFLAPAFNYEKSLNPTRSNAMKLIGQMNDVLQEYIPGKVARYNDDFEPRAFGDNIQKWGTSTILIESGGLDGDPEKQYLRKLNYLALLTAFEAIASRTYESAGLEAYRQLPFNSSGRFHDLLIREVEIEKNGHWYTVDIAFRRNEVPVNNYHSFYYRSSITDLGDLSVYYAYDDLPARGLRAIPGKVYPQVLQSVSDLQRLDPVQLLEQGYTDVRMASRPSRREVDQKPLKLVPANESSGEEIRLSANPSLLLKKGSQIRYAVINGFVYDLSQDRDRIRRAWK